MKLQIRIHNYAKPDFVTSVQAFRGVFISVTLS